MLRIRKTTGVGDENWKMVNRWRLSRCFDGFDIGLDRLSCGARADWAAGGLPAYLRGRRMVLEPRAGYGAGQYRSRWADPAGGWRADQYYGCAHDVDLAEQARWLHQQ